MLVDRIFHFKAFIWNIQWNRIISLHCKGLICFFYGLLIFSNLFKAETLRIAGPCLQYLVFLSLMWPYALCKESLIEKTNKFIVFFFFFYSLHTVSLGDGGSEIWIFRTGICIITRFFYNLFHPKQGVKKYWNHQQCPTLKKISLYQNL